MWSPRSESNAVRAPYESAVVPNVVAGCGHEESNLAVFRP
jgi:hypothetical protein